MKTLSGDFFIFIYHIFSYLNQKGALILKNFKVIESKDNSLIKLISGLQNSSKTRQENSLFVLEGLRICKDANENGIRFDKLIVSNNAFEKYYDDVLILSENSKECVKIPDSLFKKISDTKSPQGILAIATMPKSNINAINVSGRYIALENMADPSNLGAVSRTAEALGVSGIILSGCGVDPYSPKALRASMGTLLRMPLFILDNFSEEISKLGLKVFSCVVDKDAQKLTETSFEDGCVVVIGNEANGITEATKAVSDKLITIQMKGSAESLNASVAAAISIWEMMK